MEMTSKLLWNFHPGRGELQVDVSVPTRQPGESDDVLLQRMAAGDREAFGMLFERHQTTVYRFARQMSGSADLAEDVTQDVFVTVMRIGTRYDPGAARFSSYLYGIARNLVRRRLRRDRWRTILDFRSPAAIQASNLVVQHEGAQLVERRQLLDATRRAVLALPVKYREAIVLCDLNDMKYEEAAEVIGVPIGTIRSRLSRARSLLARRLRHHEPRAQPTSASKGVLHERSASEPIG